MTADETDMFRELLSDHSAHPRNAQSIPDATSSADGHNRTCGDKVSVWLKIEDGIIRDIGSLGSGCSISVSSGSLMTEAVKGKSVPEAREIFDRFHSMLTSEASTDIETMGKLAAFEGVRRFPIRVKCATLPWHTMQQAIVNS